jgi:hypothetical protein
MKITRRKLAAVLSSPVVLSSSVVLSSQVALAQTAAVAPSSPDDLLRAARERNQANAAALAAENIPMSTEPAFQFKA